MYQRIPGHAIHCAQTFEQASREAAAWMNDRINELVKQKGSASLLLAVGSSPRPLYRNLVEEYRDRIPWQAVTASGLDELWPLRRDHPLGFGRYLHDHLFSHVAIAMPNRILLDSQAEDPAAQARAFEEKIAAVGGIDIAILGVGADGHIGMNFPGSSFDSTTRLVSLPPSQQPSASAFDGTAAVAAGITCGIATICTVRSILLLADGEKKREAISHLLKSPPSPQWPVTALQAHPDLKLFASRSCL